jgi:hypothetical protein
MHSQQVGRGIFFTWTADVGGGRATHTETSAKAPTPMPHGATVNLSTYI